MLVLHHLLHLLFTLHGTFMRFLELTYWRDATVPVPCILLFLCFRKATQEIFSELDETKTETPIFPGRRTRTERELEGTRGQPHPRVVCLLARVALWWGGPGPLLMPPLRLYKASGQKTLNQSAFFPEQFRSAIAVKEKFWGTEVSVLAPWRDEEVPPEPSPSTPSPPPPSPSTSPPSPPTLLSPMMRRE
jgi:hypothetical protein